MRTNPISHRRLSGFWKWLSVLISIAMVLFYFYSAVVGTFPIQYHRGFYLLFTFILIFLYYPLKGRAEDRPNPTITDILLLMATVIICFYWIIQFSGFGERFGIETERDVIIGVMAIIVSMEAARRILGWGLVLLCILFCVYAYFGAEVPEIVSHHGFTANEIIVESFISTNGMFGILSHVLSSYVILFVFFGAFYHKSGAIRFLLDLPMALVGRSSGGAAKVAILTSALFGSISGSATLNTVSSGTFTIPLMKKSGFKPHVAGAIEPAASIGGMFLPPVMGAGGFIMAEMLEIPYSRIMAISLFPALVYFLSVFLMIHFEAGKNNLKGIADDEVPGILSVLRSGWYRCLPLAVITVLMVRGNSPGFAAFCATLTCILVSWGSRGTRMGFREIAEAIVTGSRQTLIVGATVGVVGIIVGMIELTGIGILISDLMITLSGTMTASLIIRLLIILLFVAVLSLALGLGLPVTATYLITIVLVAPLLLEIGVALVATHMVVYWFSQDSSITPPLSIPSTAGATIAGADPWKTGWTAFKFAKLLYLMPVLFSLVPGLLLDGSIEQVVVSFVSCILGTVAFTSLSQFFLIRRVGIGEWILLVPMTILLYWPTLTTTGIGAVLLLMLVFKQLKNGTPT